MTDENVEMINTPVPERRRNGNRSYQTIDEVDSVPRSSETIMVNFRIFIWINGYSKIVFCLQETNGNNTSFDYPNCVEDLTATNCGATSATDIPLVMTSSTTSTIIDMKQYRQQQQPPQPSPHYKEITKVSVIHVS